MTPAAKLRVSSSLLALLLFDNACGTGASSNLNASVNQSIEQKWSSQIDLSKEQSPQLADNLNATKSTVNFVEIGSKVGASFKFGSSVIFDVGASMEFADLFERKVFHEVVIGRAKDVDGNGDGNGVFLDQDTVAGDRYVHCKSQKVITDASNYGGTVSGGISFLGLDLSTRVGSGVKMASATDYTMNRGFYRTKGPIKLARIFELCSDIAKSDVALQNINHINEIAKLNFNAGENLEELARKVAAGEKVNDFQFHNMKMDFQIDKRQQDKIIFRVHPDTHWSDPVLSVEVNYKKEGERTVFQGIKQTCLSDCQNYHDSERSHGLKRYGEDLTKEQAEKYIRLIAMIFTAEATHSK